MIEVVFLALIGELCRSFSVCFGHSEPFEAYLVGEALVEVLLHVCEIDTIMGALRAGEGSLDLGQIELHDFSRVHWVRSSVVGDKHVLLAEVFLDQLDVRLIPASQP